MLEKKEQCGNTHEEDDCHIFFVELDPVVTVFQGLVHDQGHHCRMHPETPTLILFLTQNRGHPG